MAKSKGTPKSGGRKRGTPNKITNDIKLLAQQYAPEAMKELARLSREAVSEPARVSAIKEILDRAYGKSVQAITGEGGGPLKFVLVGGDNAL